MSRFALVVEGVAWLVFAGLYVREMRRQRRRGPSRILYQPPRRRRWS